ncbi:Ribosomal protein [Parasponia andersonii]|uniref:Ribosomal protein n=1 Tax=Parasponia andersonii TaxID=3476 RepID=A0A2P5CK48_PARAD|nr:Ribosomal protein [Parasponia andersonii]
MAAMAALQGSMSSLSLTSNSFLGQRLSPSTLCFVPVKSTEKPCLTVARLKRWERKDCKPNSLPVLLKMHVKVGDMVKVISGREKGKIGEISKIFRHNSTVVVSEINLKTKHVKSREEGEPGQIIKVEAPIHSSNVMLYSKEKEVASRVGHKTLENGKRVRYLIKTGEIIDSEERWKELKEAKKKTEVAAAGGAAGAS